MQIYNKQIFRVLMMFFSSLFFIESEAAPKEAESSIYVAPIKATPESDQVYLRIVFPEQGEMRRSSPFYAQLRLEGYSLSTYSQFDRAKRIYNNPKGQSLHVIIDNDPHFSLYVSHEDSFDENRNFLDKIISFDVPQEVKRKLSSGEHVMRVFPVRSFFESLKGRHAFDATYFYIKSKTASLNIDFRKPFLTYNMPQGTYPSAFRSPILLDFLVRNCKLAKDGYKVQLTIDKAFRTKLFYPTPYFIYGLDKGDHTIRLELLDSEDQVVDNENGLFNVTERVITIK